MCLDLCFRTLAVILVSVFRLIINFDHVQLSRYLTQQIPALGFLLLVELNRGVHNVVETENQQQHVHTYDWGLSRHGKSCAGRGGLGGGGGGSLGGGGGGGLGGGGRGGRGGGTGGGDLGGGTVGHADGADDGVHLVLDQFAACPQSLGDLYG